MAKLVRQLQRLWYRVVSILQLRMRKRAPSNIIIMKCLTHGFDLRPLSEAILYRPLSLGAEFLSVVRISEVKDVSISTKVLRVAIHT